MTVSAIVLGSNALNHSESLQFSSKAALIFWSNFESLFLFFGGDSTSKVLSLFTVMLCGLMFGPSVFRTLDLYAT